MSDTYKMPNAVVSSKRVYMRNRDMAEFEQELETSRLAAENPTNQASVPANESENPTSNDETNVDWKKRYTDLQSHADKKVAEATKKVNEVNQKNLELETVLKETQKAKTKYPTSEEELAQWCKEFPPLLPIIQTIALKAVEGRESELTDKIKKLEEISQSYVNDKGRMELLKIHPDALEIENDPRFAQWYNEQEPEIQRLIDSGEPKKIGKAITIYKKDLGIVTKSVQELQKDASKAVNVGPSATNMPKEHKTWHESEVSKLSTKEYARFERDIELARLEGRYIYDISRAN